MFNERSNITQKNIYVTHSGIKTFFRCYMFRDKSKSETKVQNAHVKLLACSFRQNCDLLTCGYCPISCELALNLQRDTDMC